MTIKRTNYIPHQAQQHGVVLIVALLLLMILSILASVSIRGASSTEQIANQDRQKVTAQQSAEAALRFCEEAVQAHELNPATGITPAPAPVGAGVLFNWEVTALQNNWDNAVAGASAPTLVPIASAGDVAGGPLYARRPAECMSQYTSVASTKVFVTTARGFGPEVPALVGPKDGTAPVGTEIWLQSVISML